MERKGDLAMNNKTLKIIGAVATVAGLGVSLVSSWVGDKKQENLIGEKVAKEVAKQLEKKK